MTVMQAVKICQDFINFQILLMKISTSHSMKQTQSPVTIIVCIGLCLKVQMLACRGVIFLNATPFWSFMPHPETAPRLVTAILPWDGTLPVPRLARFLVKNLWWNLLSRRRILQGLVRTVYADKYDPPWQAALN